MNITHQTVKGFSGFDVNEANFDLTPCRVVVADNLMCLYGLTYIIAHMRA